MLASNSFAKGLAASLAAPALVVAVALASANSPSNSAASASLSLCSLAGPIALSTASAFFSVAVYVSLAEHPARMLLRDDSAALAQWKPSYGSAAAIQAPLAAAAALLGALCWWKRRGSAEVVFPEGYGGGSSPAAADPLWLAGACAAAFNLPYTIFVILPTNAALLAAKVGSAETRALLRRWGHLHFLRVVAGGVSAACFLVAVAREGSSSAGGGGLGGRTTTPLSSWGPVASLRQLLRLSKSDYGV